MGGIFYAVLSAVFRTCIAYGTATTAKRLSRGSRGSLRTVFVGGGRSPSTVHLRLTGIIPYGTVLRYGTVQL